MRILPTTNFENISIHKTQKNTNPNFNARFTMKEDLLNYAILRGLQNGENPVVVKDKWLDVLRTCKRLFENVRPYDARVSLDLARTRDLKPIGDGELELLFNMPPMPPQEVKTLRIGNMSNPNIIDRIFSVGLQGLYMVAESLGRS